MTLWQCFCWRGYYNNVDMVTIQIFTVNLKKMNHSALHYTAWLPYDNCNNVFVEWDAKAMLILTEFLSMTPFKCIWNQLVISNSIKDYGWDDVAVALKYILVSNLESNHHSKHILYAIHSIG